MKIRLAAAFRYLTSGYRGRLLISVLASVCYSAYVFQYIEFDNHTLEALLSQSYDLGDISHQKRYSVLYSLTYLLVRVLRVEPYPALVSLIFLYIAFLSFVILLWMDRFLRKPSHKLFFFLCFFFLFPAQVGTFLTKDNNLSYYGFFLLALFAIITHTATAGSRLLAGLASGLAAASYVFFNFLAVAGAIFFFFGKSLKDRLTSLFLLGLLPLLFYQCFISGVMGEARQSWDLGVYWHRDLIHYGLSELLGMFNDYKWGLYWNFGQTIPSFVAYSLLFLYAIYVFLRASDLGRPQKLCVLAALVACNGFTFLMKNPAPDHWGPLCLVLWCIFLISFERFGTATRRVTVLVCLAFFAQSFAVLRAEREETFIGFSGCQVKLLKLYAEDEKQFKKSVADYYVFPLAYLQVSSYIVMRWPDLRHKILFTADGASFYQPVINVFKSKKFRASPFIRSHGLKAPNNLSGEEYLYIRNPEALALLAVAAQPGENSFVSSQVGQSLCIDGG